MKKSDLIFIIGTVVCIGVLSIGTILTPDVSFSENENRYLQERPVLNLQTILNGRYESQMEEYLSDQIIGREKWVSGKSLTEAALGIRDINGVYLCEDGRVVERITESQFNWTQFGKNLQQIEQLQTMLQEEKISVDLMMVPTAAYIYKETLPQNAMLFDEDKAFRQAKKALGDHLLDLRKPFLAEDMRNTFFKTDHHWTGYGAFLAYKEYMYHLGSSNSDLSYEDMDPQVLTSEFKGTLYSKVLLETLGIDAIETPKIGMTADYQVEIEGREYDTLYFDSYLEKKDKYGVYFGGNYDKVEIQVKNSKGKEKLLIIKDSFANSFVPYLLPDFSQITMVDTRYYRDDISELAQGYDRVLILYSISNLAEERLNLTQALLR